MKQIVDSNQGVGLLAYLSGQPVGWIALAQRHEYLRIADYGSPDAWVIGCIYLGESARGKGLARALIEAAVNYAKQNGAVQLEAIPRGWRAGGDIGVERITQSFLAAGFQLVDPVTEGVSFRISSPWTPPPKEGTL